MSVDEPIKIYDASSLYQARLLVERLADDGIEARVASDAIEPLAGRVPFRLATCPVWVIKSDAARAQVVVREFECRLHEQSSTDDRHTRPFCYHCGVEVAVDQSRCANCGGALDWSE